MGNARVVPVWQSRPISVPYAPYLTTERGEYERRTTYTIRALQKPLRQHAAQEGARRRVAD